jgi:antitoxin (DNA-binding transcriptional repressor) of toxin-antitoxin stability system
MKAVTATEARDQLAEHLNLVAYRGERIPIKRRGKIMAFLVPVHDMETLEAIEDVRDAADAAKALEEFEATGAAAVPYTKARKTLSVK